SRARRPRTAAEPDAPSRLGLLSEHGCGALPAAPHPDEQGDDREHQRRNEDVDDLQLGPELLDVLVELGPYRPQLLADAQLLILEVIQLLLLLRGQHERRFVAALGLQGSKLLLSVAQLLFQLLLLRMEAIVGDTAQRIDALEGPRIGRA